MIRAFFFALGVFVSLCGGLLLFIDQIVLTDYASDRLKATTGQQEPIAAVAGDSPWRLVSSVAEDSDSPVGHRTVVDPPDWSAFGLLSVGVVTILYTLALPSHRDDEE